MTQAYLEKNIEQLNQLSAEPQKIFRQLQEAHQQFLTNLTNAFGELPNASQNYFLQQQEKAKKLHEKISDTVKNNPNDWSQVGNILLNYQSEQFSENLKQLKENTTKFQKLFAPYNNVELPMMVKDLVEQSRDEFTKATNEAIKLTQEGFENTKEHLRKTTNNLKENQDNIVRQTRNTTNSAKKAVKKTINRNKPAVKKVVQKASDNGNNTTN